MSNKWLAGSSAEWKAIRLAVLDDAEWRCQIRLEGTWRGKDGGERHCLGRADCVHHTRDRRIVGDDPRFLQAACSPCNLKIGDPTRGDPEPTPATRW